VTSLPAPTLPESTLTLCLFLVLLIPFAGAGLALMNTGLGRSRNAAHAMMSSLCVIGIAALVYSVVGFAWQGFIGRHAHVFNAGVKPWSWLADEPFFLRGLELDGSPASLAALFGMLGAGLTALIPVGSAADRWRLGASCASTALLAGWTFPLFAHWVWGGGWLAQLGVNYGLGHGFVDAGGGGSIQVVGGLTALALAWILGPRRGKYSADGMPAAIPGHNTVLTLFGCFLGWLGWIGLNGAGAILFTGAESGRVVLIVVNTTLAAVSAMLAVAMITGARFGRPDASLCANGWIGGLVASSAGCAVIRPAAAVIIGLIAGGLVTYSVEWLELHLDVDDPGGSISVHAVAGVWGVLAVGLFARAAGSGQWLAQLVGVATLIGFVLPLTYGLNWLLNRFYPQRVAIEGERQGLDLHELGAGAYPDFVVHNEDFFQR
jgi:Amt family ammonium transporter